MLSLVSCFFIFFFLFVLIVVYHLYFWNVFPFIFDNRRVWVSSFECGFLGNVLVENVFSYTYFVLLVFFVVFDLEVSLLINMPYQGGLYVNYLFYYFFVFVLVIGYSFEVWKGYVSWNY